MRLIVTDIGTWPGRKEKEDIVLNSRMRIDSCDRCLDCWFRTDGVCTKNDGMTTLAEALHESDELVLVSRCFYGSFSSFVKKILDRCTSYLKAGYEISEGRMRHEARWRHDLQVSAFFYGEDISQAQRDNAEKMVENAAFELHARIRRIVFVSDPWAIGGMEA